MPRLINNADFFSMKELHLSFINEMMTHGKIESLMSLISTGAVRLNETLYPFGQEYEYLSKEISIYFRVGFKEKKEIEIDLIELQYEDTLDFFERYFGMKNVLASKTVFNGQGYYIQCAIVITEEKWEKLLSRDRKLPEQKIYAFLT